jgi:hypothetical protein
MIQIATVFTEEIRRRFRDHLPRDCINLLCLMAEQSQQLEQAINVVHEQNKKLMKFVVLSTEYRQILEAQQKQFEKDFEQSNLTAEAIKGEDNDNG